jgi:hypothetical protein
MAVLTWKHGTTADAAREAIQAEIRRLGYEGYVTWKGNDVTASAGLGTLVSVSGRVTDEAVVLEKCGGALGGTVLSRCRELLERALPGGEQGNQPAP